MGRLTVRLPDALHQQLEALARKEGVSMNQYLVYALTRQATLDTYLKPEHFNQPDLPVKHTAAQKSIANPQGESQEIRHLQGSGLPPPGSS